MKIKTLLQAPLILEELKRLKIDPTTLNPNYRVKIKDGVVFFEPEKDRFISKHTDGHQCPLVDKDPIKYDAGPKPEQLEYYYLKEGDVIQEGDEFEGCLHQWHNATSLSIGNKLLPNRKGWRRKIQKNPTS